MHEFATATVPMFLSKKWIKVAAITFLSLATSSTLGWQPSSTKNDGWLCWLLLLLLLWNWNCNVRNLHDINHPTTHYSEAEQLHMHKQFEVNKKAHNCANRIPHILEIKVKQSQSQKGLLNLCWLAIKNHTQDTILHDMHTWKQMAVQSEYDVIYHFSKDKLWTAYLHPQSVTKWLLR